MKKRKEDTKRPTTTTKRPTTTTTTYTTTTTEEATTDSKSTDEMSPRDLSIILGYDKKIPKNFKEFKKLLGLDNKKSIIITND